VWARGLLRRWQAFDGCNRCTCFSLVGENWRCWMEVSRFDAPCSRCDPCGRPLLARGWENGGKTDVARLLKLARGQRIHQIAGGQHSALHEALHREAIHCQSADISCYIAAARNWPPIQGVTANAEYMLIPALAIRIALWCLPLGAGEARASVNRLRRLHALRDFLSRGASFCLIFGAAGRGWLYCRRIVVIAYSAH
jgi:hypothetical protein